MIKNYNKLLQKYIPGGAHTYSRGFDQFPSNAPQILFKGKGAYISVKNSEHVNPSAPIHDPSAQLSSTWVGFFNKNS
jgi:hypothetical protein